MTISINALPGVGAEVHGVDIAKGIDSAELEIIKHAFSRYGLVFLRDQDISETDHIELAGRFGDINVNRFFHCAPKITLKSPW